MAGRSDLAAFILAGGKSSRMGTDKAFLEHGGRTLLSHALELARLLTPDVFVVGSREKFERYSPVIEDVFPGQGPLAGIHAALRSSSADLNLMIAVDMPLLSPKFLRYLVDRARSSTATVTVPRAGGRWYPLCAVYRPAFAVLAEDVLKLGRNKIDPLFAQTETLTIEDEELKKAEFVSSMFHNLNTPQEFLELAEEKIS
ncbi:MAG TPA: molybdenum cofactor guanylyltransferase [Candidatus Sulfotelmatobacter sp.]|jgi:molybdopterin-guanine dinucleotide biosynthesis protein A